MAVLTVTIPFQDSTVRAKMQLPLVNYNSYDRLPVFFLLERGMQPNPKLLIADGDESAALLLSTQLIHNGYYVSALTSGRELVRTIQNDPPPDLLILDMGLPFYNGLQVLPLIQTIPAWQHVQVILLSSQIGESHEILAFDLGAADYVLKPIKPAALAARIKRRLRDGGKA